MVEFRTIVDLNLHGELKPSSGSSPLLRDLRNFRVDAARLKLSIAMHGVRNHGP